MLEKGLSLAQTGQSQEPGKASRGRQGLSGQPLRAPRAPSVSFRLLEASAVPSVCCVRTSQRSHPGIFISWPSLRPSPLLQLGECVLTRGGHRVGGRGACPSAWA